MIALKADFHLHTSDDRYDWVDHTSEELIDTAARRGFTVLAITNHDTFTFNRELESYASDRGILLIPGIEKKIERKHVLLLNATQACEKINDFEDLRKAKLDGVFVIAPHPFFGTAHCLGKKLIEHLGLFDALEFTYFYSEWFNLNREAVRLSHATGKPLVGNSDCHLLKYFGICHSIIHAEGWHREEIFSAIRNGRIEIVTRPIFLPRLFAMLLAMNFHKHRIKRQRHKKTESVQGQHVQDDVWAC